MSRTTWRSLVWCASLVLLAAAMVVRGDEGLLSHARLSPASSERTDWSEGAFAATSYCTDCCVNDICRNGLTCCGFDSSSIYCCSGGQRCVQVDDNYPFRCQPARNAFAANQTVARSDEAPPQDQPSPVVIGDAPTDDTKPSLPHIDRFPAPRNATSSSMATQNGVCYDCCVFEECSSGFSCCGCDSQYCYCCDHYDTCESTGGSSYACMPRSLDSAKIDRFKERFANVSRPALHSNERRGASSAPDARQPDGALATPTSIPIHDEASDSVASAHSKSAALQLVDAQAGRDDPPLVRAQSTASCYDCCIEDSCNRGMTCCGYDSRHVYCCSNYDSCIATSFPAPFACQPRPRDSLVALFR